MIFFETLIIASGLLYKPDERGTPGRESDPVAALAPNG